MTIKKFLVLSILIHVIILSGIYLIPVQKEKKSDEFFAMLISPEELQKPETKLPQYEMQPLYQPPPLIGKIKPKTSPLSDLKKAPLSKGEPLKPRLMAPPETPIVPDGLEDAGKKHGEVLYPKAGIKDGLTEDKGGKSALKPGYSEREKIFDRGVIGGLAKKDSDKEKKKDDSVTFDTSEYKYKGYMKRLKERIESIWVYPPDAKVRGIYGDLKIRFTIKKDGKLGTVELVRTSGYKMLDDAAVRALKDGEPYWPLPEDWGVESYTILGHFVYNIYGYYVR